MKRLVSAGILLIVLAVLFATGTIHTYGHPGSPNGGIVIAGYGVEFWGTPGFFTEEH